MGSLTERSIFEPEQNWLDWEAATCSCLTDASIHCRETHLKTEASSFYVKARKNNPVCHQIPHFNMFVQQRKDNSWEQTVGLIGRQISK